MKGAIEPKVFFGLFITIMALGFSPSALADRIRVGWQIPWATEGQLVMGLKYSNIAQLTGAALTFEGFSYGAPLNQAALGGNLDILLTADQPALVLLARTNSFSIVARLMYNRVCVYSDPSGPVDRLSAVAGRRIMGPVGAAAERIAFELLAKAGVSEQNVQQGPLDMAEQMALIARGKDGWRSVDALYGFDPFPAVFEERGLARMLGCGNVVSLVLASDEVITRRPEDLTRFLVALKLSWFLFTDKPAWANRRFVREARLDVSDRALDLAASVEPNRMARQITDIRLGLVEADWQTLRSAQDFLVKRGTVREPVRLVERIRLDALRAADARTDLPELARQIEVQD